MCVCVCVCARAKQTRIQVDMVVMIPRTQALEHPWLASLDAKHSAQNLHADKKHADAPVLPAQKVRGRG